MSLQLRLLATWPVGLLSVLATAQVAFNDFSSDANSSTFGYATNVGNPITGARSPDGLIEFANRFVSGATGTVTDVILPVGLAGGSGNVDVALFTDNSGLIGGTVLETWVMSTDGAFGTYYPPSVLTGTDAASLTSGTAYWVVATPDGAATSNLFAAWNVNDDAVGGNLAFNEGSGWNYESGALDAFRVDVVPEPPAMICFAAGGLCLLLRRKR